MQTIALFALLMPTLTAMETPAPSLSVQQDPPLRVWLNRQDNLNFGDRVRVYVRSEQDGHLMVLHADPEGRIRVLFPIDPYEDDFIRGGRDFEIRDRQNREAIRTAEDVGYGTLYVAFSMDPFRYGDFSRGDHWDYRSFDDYEIAGDAEPVLTQIAQRMAVGSSFIYETDSYYLNPPAAYTRAYRSYRYSYLRVGYGYDPFYYDPFYYDPSYLGFGYRRFYGGYYYGPSYSYRPSYYSRSSVVSVNYNYTIRNRPVVASTYRDRRLAPSGILASARRTTHITRAQPRRASTVIARGTPTRATPARSSTSRSPIQARPQSSGGRRATPRRSTATRSALQRSVTQRRWPSRSSVSRLSPSRSSGRSAARSSGLSRRSGSSVRRSSGGSRRSAGPVRTTSRRRRR